MSPNIRKKRMQYKLKREKQLEKVETIQNNIGNHDIELLELYKPYRKRANGSGWSMRDKKED